MEEWSGRCSVNGSELGLATPPEWATVGYNQGSNITLSKCVRKRYSGSPRPSLIGHAGGGRDHPFTHVLICDMTSPPSHTRALVNPRY